MKKGNMPLKKVTDSQLCTFCKFVNITNKKWMRMKLKTYNTHCLNVGIKNVAGTWTKVWVPLAACIAVSHSGTIAWEECFSMPIFCVKEGVETK